MGATPEQYKEWQNRASQGTLYLSQILDELPEDQWFALGATSSWFFIGDKKTFWRDMDTLDAIYYRMMTRETPHIMFVMQKVIEVYLRHWEGEHLLILIKLEGGEEGYISFERDYPAFLAFTKNRLENKQKLPRGITFDRNGNVVKRYKVPSHGDKVHVMKVIIYDLEGNELGIFPSVKAAAKFAGIPWYSLDKILHNKRKHPSLRFEYYEDEAEKGKGKSK